jgi:hypothetical protein
MHLSRRSVVAAMAGIAAVAVGVPIVVGRSVAGAAADTRLTNTITGASLEPTPEPTKSEPAPQPSEPVFPQPGGGPIAIHLYNDGTDSYLLDTATGQYPKVPYQLHLAPDERTLAVEDIDGRVGLADRTALLRDGGAAVRWTPFTSEGGLNWSPDGTALLATTLDRKIGRFTAQRYDIATRQIRQTRVNLDSTGAVGWAADSRRYVVELANHDSDGVDGPMRYINPDGTPGPFLGMTGHIWNATSYSPSRRYAIAEPARDETFPDADALADWQCPRILDLWSGKVIATIRTGWPALGWYDDQHVVRIAPARWDAPTVLEVVDIHTGTVSKRVSASGLPPFELQLGSSRWLRGGAANLGF